MMDIVNIEGIMNGEVPEEVEKRVEKILSKRFDIEYKMGRSQAASSILKSMLTELNYEGTEVEHSKWILEKEATIRILKRLCAKHGDLDWDDSLSLPEIIEKHLICHLVYND